MNMPLKILIFTIVLMSRLTSLSGQHYSIRHFNPENGLNGTYVYTTVEGPKGYKWIGTDYGLLRFDGLNFEMIDLNDSTKSNFPTAALSKKNGLLLFGYYNGAVKAYNGVEVTSIYTPSENSSAIRSLVEDDSGTIWALTQNDGVIRLNDHKGELLKPNELHHKKSNALTCQGNVMLIATNEGLLIYQIGSDKSLAYYGQVEALTGLSVQTMLKRPNSSTYWIGTDNDGIYQLILADTRKNQINISAYQADFLRRISVVSIKEARNKDLWITTKYEGLIKVNFNRNNTKPRQFTYMNSDNGFPGDQLSTLFFDQDENIWVGTLGDGLIQVTKEGQIFYNFERFKARLVNCISGTNKHEFLFGTDVGMIKAFYSGEADSLNFELVNHEIVKRQNITALFINDNDKVFFSIRNKGLYYSDVNFEHVTPIEFDHGSKKIKIRNIVQDNDGFLWLSLMHNGVFVLDTLGNIREHYATKTGFFHNEIYDIHIDSKGNKWFAAHSAGLAVIKPDGQINYLTKEGIFPPRDINDISEDEMGNVWIGTYGNGVFEYDGENFIEFSTKDGLLNNYCNSVMSDRNNHIWISHRAGLTRIDEHTNAVSTVEEKDGLSVAEFIPGSIYRDHDHNIWLGNRNGVTFLNAPDEMFEPKMLQTIVTNVKIDHESVDLYEFSSDEEIVGKIPSHMTFPYDNNNLTFEYIAINLKNPLSNLYQFKLEGYDDNWSPATKANSINYTNLSPGDYDFQIRQSDNPNHWTDNVTHLNFTILPSWWNTLWAKTLFVVITILSIYAVIRIRTTRLKKRLEEKKYFLEVTESQNRRLKNFAFITSHNMRSSTVNLSSLITLVEDEPNNKEYFDLLRTTAKKLNMTVQHVSDLLNFENRISDEEKVDCDILETIERVITLNSQAIENNQADIVVDIPRNTKVKAIPAYLDSVYNNLITNAVRYGITDSSKKINITAKSNEKEIVVCIKDYGLGIDMKKYRTKLFDLGSRFHSAKSDGHGIGLFMSKNQLEAMGGRIEVDSEVDKGTTIKVKF